MRNSHRAIIIVLLILLGFPLLIYSSSINENLEGKIYQVTIGMHAKDLQGNKIEPLYIQSFAFNYDFSEQKGNIFFRVDNNLTFYSASIHFPTTVKPESFKVFHLKGNEKIKINKEVENEEGNYPYVSFSDHDNLILEKGDGLLIEFESELVPKARFNFIIDKDLVLYHPDGEAGNINLIVGNGYQCIAPCVYGLKNVEEKYNSFDGNIKLDWQTGNQNHLFYINTFSRCKLFFKNLTLSLGLAFIILVFNFIPFSSRKESKMENILDGNRKIKGVGEKTLEKLRKEIK